MLSSNKKCSECGDTGEYKVYNAYNLDDAQTVPCEYCLPKDRAARKLALN